MSEDSFTPLGYSTASMARLALQDPEAAAAIAAEITRQQEIIELIASENYVSQAVLDAQGRTRSSRWRSSGPGRCSGPTTPMSSLTRARRRMPPPIWRC
jgi:hypothetical protein